MFQRESNDEVATMLDRRFDEFLRRGGETPRFEMLPSERKFNPYHDPDDGRFTFAPGGGSLASRVRPSGSSATTNPARIPTSSAQKPRAAPQPAAPSARVAHHGALSARFESRAKGDPGAVSTGKGDTGGISYGTHQLSSNMGTVAEFLASPEGSRWSREFRGLKPGSSAFSEKWRQVAARESSPFGAAQNSFVDRTLYSAAARSLDKRTGLDIELRSETLRQVTYSTAVQHGPSGGAGLIARAVVRTDKLYARTDPRYEAILINHIYDARSAFWIAKRDAQLKARDKEGANTSNNVVTIRLPNERAVALKLLRGG